jgi:hypothetical protein
MRLGVLQAFATPIKRTWFGENKTYRGVFCVALGTVVGFVVIAPPFLLLGREHRAIELALLGLIVCAAAMLAELPNSFLKRWMGIAPGAQADGIGGVAFHVLDQIDVVFGAWAILAWVAKPTMGQLGVTLGTVYIGHQLVSLIGSGSACARAHDNERVGRDVVERMKRRKRRDGLP